MVKRFISFLFEIQLGFPNYILRPAVRMERRVCVLVYYLDGQLSKARQRSGEKYEKPFTDCNRVGWLASPHRSSSKNILKLKQTHKE